MAQTDLKLIDEIINGNESALEILVKRYYDLIYSFVYRNTNDYNISYDITQEIFIKMMKNINKYDATKGEFRSWLLKMSVNTTRDYFKSKDYIQRKDSVDIESTQIEDKSNVVDIISKKETSIKMKEAIEELPKLQREAIILKYYEDLKIKEISNITGENENTIKSRLFNGVKSLKKILGGDINGFKESEHRKSKM